MNQIPAALSLLRASCTMLMRFPDRSGASGDVALPDGAAGPPRVSRDGRTYTFTVRRGLRFSDGAALTGRNYGRAIQRLRIMGTRFGFYMGEALTSDFASVHTTRTSVRITLERPAGDLLARLAMPAFCPVPVDFPIDPAGVTLTAGSGPYHVATQVGGRLVVLRPNRFYRGARERRFGEITLTIGGSKQTVYEAVSRGTYDYAFNAVPEDETASAVAKYGVGKGRLFYRPQSLLFYIRFNLRRGVFRDNPRLRRAVGFALDRRAFFSSFPFGARRTGHMIPRAIPGFRADDVFPIGAPNVALAHRLADGHRAGGRVNLYVLSGPRSLRQAGVIRYDLAQIGLDVTVSAFDPAVLFGDSSGTGGKLGDPNEPWDMVSLGWWADYADPANFFGPLVFDKAWGWNAPSWARRYSAVSRLVGSARSRGFARLDHDLMEQEAPIVPLGAGTTLALVSPRLSCVSFSSVSDLNVAGLCLRG